MIERHISYCRYQGSVERLQKNEVSKVFVDIRIRPTLTYRFDRLFHGTKGTLRKVRTHYQKKG